MKKVDLSGLTFNNWKVLNRNESRRGYWNCICTLCNSGEIKQVYHSGLISNKSKSCGCKKGEEFSRINKGNTYNKKYNKYDLSGKYGVGYTSNTNEEFYFDLEDYDKIKNYCWFISNGYIYGYIDKKRKTLHSFLINNTDKNFIIDHVNRIRHDNRKENLRIATQQQNCFNSSKIRENRNEDNIIGVLRSGKNWRATLTKDGIKYELGSYKNKDWAILNRLLAEKKYFKEFSPQRHLFKDYGISEDFNNEY